MLPKPTNGDPYLTRLVGTLNAEIGRKEPLVIGTSFDGSNFLVRFRAALDTPWVQVHVQSTALGGGGLAYDPATYVSSTLVDCRANRLQSETIAATAGVVYAAFLIPVQYDGAGAKILYDGQGGRPDAMANCTNYAIPGTVFSHNVLSTSHSDTLADTVVRGDLIIGNATPKWSRLAHGTVGQFFKTDGTDVAWADHGLTAASVGAEPTITAGTSAQYWRGDKTWQTLGPPVIPSGNFPAGASYGFFGNVGVTVGDFSGYYLTLATKTVTGRLAVVDNALYGGEAMFLGTDTAHPLHFRTNQNIVMSITSAPAFTMGTTTNPGSFLLNASATAPQLVLRAGGANAITMALDQNNVTREWVGYTLQRRGVEYWFLGLNATNETLIFWANGARTAASLTTAGTLQAVAFSGPLTGNASTASALSPGATINGVTFTGAANIDLHSFTENVTTTVTAQARGWEVDYAGSVARLAFADGYGPYVGGFSVGDFWVAAETYLVAKFSFNVGTNLATVTVRNPIAGTGKIVSDALVIGATPGFTVDASGNVSTGALTAGFGGAVFGGDVSIPAHSLVFGASDPNPSGGNQVRAANGTDYWGEWDWGGRGGWMHHRAGNAAGYGTARYDTSFGSPSALLAGEPIADIFAKGYDGSAVSEEVAQVMLYAGEDWSPTAHGSEIRLRTTLRGTVNTLATSWKVDVDRHFVPNGDNTYDLGIAAFRVRTGRFATSVQSPLFGTVTAADVVVARNSITRITFGASSTSLVGSLLMVTDTTGVLANTTDGSDNQRVAIAGGGATSATRGGYILLYGNEYATTPGEISIATGSGGDLTRRINLGGHLYPDSVTAFDVGEATNKWRTGYFGTSVVTPLLSATTRVTSPLLGTTTAVDVVLDRNSVPQLTLGSLLARFAGDVTLAAGKVYKINSVQVVGAQGAAVADATGGAVQDAEARAALNALLARVRAHGLIAT